MSREGDAVHTSLVHECPSELGKLEGAIQTGKLARRRGNSPKDVGRMPRGREEMVRRPGSMSAAVVAAGCGVSPPAAENGKAVTGMVASRRVWSKTPAPYAVAAR